VKSDRSRIGSVTTIERAVPMEARVHPSHPQPRSRRLPRASVRVGTRVPIGRNAGGHGEAGMESEEGRAF
jgi:hypothetical protein